MHEHVHGDLVVVSVIEVAAYAFGQRATYDHPEYAVGGDGHVWHLPPTQENPGPYGASAQLSPAEVKPWPHDVALPTPPSPGFAVAPQNDGSVMGSMHVWTFPVAAPEQSTRPAWQERMQRGLGPPLQTQPGPKP